MAWSKQEFEIKLDRIRKLMKQDDLDDVLITAQVNFKWLTGGRPFVNRMSGTACADLLVTEDRAYLISNNIEAVRLMTEELDGLPLEKVDYQWYEQDGLKKRLKEILEEKKVTTDMELGMKFDALRWDLLEQEHQRFEDTGGCVAKILEEVAYEIKPGDSEQDAAGFIKKTSACYGVTPHVNLAAADDRAFCYRHPLPTGKRIEKYVLLAIAGEKHGLVASATRLVHFGSVPEDLRKRHEAVLKVDAAFIGSTVAGTKVRDVFEKGKMAYRSVGFPDEWKNHHQGGMAGYNSREFRATGYSEETVKTGQAYAWNPTIAGVKSEDTILVGKTGPIVLTHSGNFPAVEVEYQGFSIKRPDILIR